jgi:hypothetical protein
VSANANVNGRRIRVWTAPIVLGVLTSFGLVSALLSDDIGDVLAWLTVGAPVAVVFWYIPRRQGESKATRDETTSSGSACSTSD